MDANLYPFNDIPRISSPTTEGNPFETGSGGNTAWAGSNKAAYDTPVTTGRITYTTLNPCTGFSGSVAGDAKIVVRVYKADGINILTGGTLDTSTTNALYQNQSFTNGTGITLTVSNYGADLPTKFKASVQVIIDAGTILAKWF